MGSTRPPEENDDTAGRFVPLAAVVQASTHADGAEHGIGAGIDAVHFFDQGFGGETDIQTTTISSALHQLMKSSSISSRWGWLQILHLRW
jgi:hypothetical protein